MRIATLEVQNFRGIFRCKLSFGQHVVLVGPNNVGKTTVIEALALLLGRDRMIRALTEHDFHNCCPKPADRIKIVAAIGGFLGNNPNTCPDWISAKRGVAKWLDPTTGDIRAIQDATHTELVCEIALMARFDADSLEVEHVRYFQDDESQDPFDDESVIALPQHLVQELGFFLISARRSWDRMFSFGSELFRRVVSASEGLPAASILQERDRLRAPQNPLEEDERLRPIIEEVEGEMASLFGTAGRVRLMLTTTDSDGVMDAIVPHYVGAGDATVPASRQGSGLISLQSLFLLLHFGNSRIADGKGFIVALEEPELHLPPSIQRRVLHRLQALSSQTIITTHSPLIAAFAQPTELCLVRNIGGNLTGKPMLAAPLSHASPNQVRRLFQLRRVEVTTALMNEVVLVTEGEIDVEWLTLLQRLTEFQPGGAGSEFGARVGLFSGRPEYLAIFISALAAAHPAVSGLVDGDSPGQGYATQLDTPSSGAQVVLRWPDGWTIENVIAWIIEADETAVLARLSTELYGQVSSLADIIARLKNDDASDPLHLKGDRAAYETVAAALADSRPCLARTGDLLDSLAVAARGQATPRFQVSENSRIVVFQP